MRKIIVYVMWALLGISVLAAGLAFYAINEGWIGYMPPIQELQNPINRYATQVISADGKVMGTWNYNRENRIMVDYTQLSPSLVQALVATEDVRFYEHSGIDFFALGRAIVKRGVLGQKSAGGGSTITQQLAKQLYSATAHSVMERLLQKPIEWVIAVKLERNYTKDEIIAMYLNYFDFLHNAVGIKTAANTYFGKEPKDLSVTESAVLIGLCKNPSYFNPVRYPERSTERRNVVLHQMMKADYLTEAEYEKYSKEPLNLHFHVADHKDGVAVYFRDFLRRYMMAKKPKRSEYPSWNMVKYHIVSLLHEYGIRNPEIHPSMALCLGPCEITVGEMVSAYTAFVNHGIRAAHMFVTSIEDSEGNTIAQFQPRMNEVISEESANKMIYMLKAVVDGGTAGRLRHKYGFTGELAGKTGTTNNNSDAWFMGITPTLVSGVWVGGDDRDIHFASMAMGQGATMALPVFALYMQKVYKDKQLGYNEQAVFDLPPGYNPCEVDESGLSDAVDDDIEEVFE